MYTGQFKPNVFFLVGGLNNLHVHGLFATPLQLAAAMLEASKFPGVHVGYQWTEVVVLPWMAMNK